ncbi:DoxX family protein [Nocardiopsis sp. EMB25]|uniref:DoxX family protein n=1 Tax=Nocardiopsis sp. EMB25 TaxID=2835867 RepID=UPI00228364F3|nr:DoxX family protein [Nocardiopsis sp. EMB25]MCY9785496.1 DoxX family protein [Nocardiopsis sp. EMB25]
MTTIDTVKTNAPGRAANVGLWVLQVLLAGAFLMAAYTKLAATPQAVEGFEQIGLGLWFMYAIGVVELAGAVALLVPALSGPAALGLAALLVGATVTQLLVDEPATALFPVAYLVPMALVAWGRRARTARLVRLLGGRG